MFYKGVAGSTMTITTDWLALNVYRKKQNWGFQVIRFRFSLQKTLSIAARKSFDLFAGNLEIGPHTTTARRVIVLLSPESLNSCWTEASVSQAFKQLSNLSARTVVITLKDPPGPICAKHSQTTLMMQKSRVSHARNLTTLRWRECDERDFWYRLRLALPAARPASRQRKNDSVAMIVQPEGRSRDSLEVLV